MGLSPEPVQHIGRTPQQSQKPQTHHQSRTDNPLNKGGGSSDANREWELSGGMNVNEIDNEETQRAKWRR